MFIKLLLSVLCVATCFIVNASGPFIVWRDSPDGRRYRINVRAYLMDVESTPGYWSPFGRVEIRNLDSKELPPTVSVEPLYINDSIRWLLVDCTQQVLRFDFKRKVLERHDKTYYRGYNCGATRFLRRDTLYSFGGVGFWHSNKILTYYKVNAREWESILHGSEGPPSLWRGASCYLPKQDIFFSALNYHLSDSEQYGKKTYSSDVFTFSFNENKWTKIGELSEELRTELDFDWATESSVLWTGRFFLFRHFSKYPNRIFIIDPIRNRVKVWKDSGKYITNTTIENHPNYTWGDSLFFYRYNSTESGVSRISFSINKLWEEAKPIGKFYIQTDSVVPNKHIIFGFAVAIALAAGLILRHYQRTQEKQYTARNEQKNNWLQKYFDETERVILSAMVASHSKGGVSGETLNEMLKTSKKMPEHQRRIRSEMISSLNTKLFYKTGERESIERIPTELDKRMYLYRLKEECYQRLGILHENNSFKS